MLPQPDPVPVVEPPHRAQRHVGAAVLQQAPYRGQGDARLRAHQFQQPFGLVLQGRAWLELRRGGGKAATVAPAQRPLWLAVALGVACGLALFAVTALVLLRG